MKSPRSSRPPKSRRPRAQPGVALGPRLAAYSTTALAALALAPAAHAQIINITDFNVGGSETTTPPSVAVNGGSQGTVEFNAGAAGPFKGQFSLNRTFQPASAIFGHYIAHIGSSAKLLHASDVIKDQPISYHANSFMRLARVTTGGARAGAFLPPANGAKTGYIGFKGYQNGNTYYGWVRVKVTGDAGGIPNSVSLVASADNPGIFGAYDISTDPDIGTFTAGEIAGVPEPTEAAIGLGLLAFGAAGVREMRRRRNALDRR